ncbi:MAG: zinc-dependent metalloprotease [Gemmatimonadales bacterium]
MALVLPLAAGCAASSASTQRPANPPPAARDSAAAQSPARPPAGRAQQAGPKPYAQVVTKGAKTDQGVVTVHELDGKYLFEVPDTLLGRDLLLVTRIAGVAPGLGGFFPAGVSVNEQVVRWERRADRLLLRKHSFDAVADDDQPIAQSVAANNFAPILGSFPIQAFGKDSASFVVDVTDFFQGDTPAIGGLSQSQRRNYQVRRLDPGRSAISSVRSYPENVEVRHLQTFEAAAPPDDAATGTISLEMAQSVVLLPKVPMRPRHADDRVGFFSVRRVNYGLDELKAATETFIRRWRLEPKDTAAYRRGELVEPVKPIVYYIDPATPTRWRKYVRQGVLDWQGPFESAGFKNAILAKDPPSKAEDPDWDPEDIRYSVVRWAASLTRNAQGPSTSDPRTGEIIESDIVWYHNHLRSYRNRLLIETGAANPAARTLDIDDELMGETMRQVIAHEIGHALGRPHNMVASSAYPTDSLRNPGFARRMGVSPSVMDYARQNYVAQPGDGLQPLDFVRHIGPYDHYVINWGYRSLVDAPTAEAEKATLHGWIMERADDPMYRYLSQGINTDPRSQTEDMGDDPVKASSYAIANLKRVVPNLVDWTTKPGESYDDLDELYGELLGQWGTYVRHVVTPVGGVHVTMKSSDQGGAVYEVVPRARQKAAMAWLASEVFEAPTWLNRPEILARVGGTGGVEVISRRQAQVLGALLDARRMARMAEAQVISPETAYSQSEFLEDLRRAVWLDPAGGRAIDAYRRALQRAYLERVETLMTEELPRPQGNPFFGPQSPPPSVARSDIRPLLRAELVALKRSAQSGASRASDRLTRAHLADVASRIDAILEGKKGS